MALIYQVTNLINGKRYIGATRFTVEKRWADFDSISDAAEAMQLSISDISKVCLGKRKKLHGLTFKFI